LPDVIGLGLFDSGCGSVRRGRSIKLRRLIPPSLELPLAFVLACFTQQPTRWSTQMIKHLGHDDANGGIIMWKGGKRTPEGQLLFVAPSDRRDSRGMLNEKQHLADRLAIVPKQSFLNLPGSGTGITW
jgi:hypothetical protein